MRWADVQLDPAELAKVGAVMLLAQSIIRRLALAELAALGAVALVRLDAWRIVMEPSPLAEEPDRPSFEFVGQSAAAFHASKLLWGCLAQTRAALGRCRHQAPDRWVTNRVRDSHRDGFCAGHAPHHAGGALGQAIRRRQERGSWQQLGTVVRPDIQGQRREIGTACLRPSAHLSLKCPDHRGDPRLINDLPRNFGPGVQASRPLTGLCSYAVSPFLSATKSASARQLASLTRGDEAIHALAYRRGHNRSRRGAHRGRSNHGEQMNRPITLFTGQYADIPIATLAEKAGAWGFDGLELACWGDHFNIRRAIGDATYPRRTRQLLARHGLGCWAISNHLVGQAVCDTPIDARHRAVLPTHVWGDGIAEGVRQRASQEMVDTARAAAALGITQVNGFTGSSIWHMLAAFPPVTAEMIDRGYEDFVERWTPILDAFQREGVKFGLEIHPGEIAYDYWTADRALREMAHPAFGINLDPSHLHWQQVDPVLFIEQHADRIMHVHMKDAVRRVDGRNGILASHLPFGDGHRGWDFRAVGRGDVEWENLIRALDRIGYSGPLSVEWEDLGLAREVAAPESLQFVRRLAGGPSDRQFDAAFRSDADGTTPDVTAEPRTGSSQSLRRPE